MCIVVSVTPVVRRLISYILGLKKLKLSDRYLKSFYLRHPVVVLGYDKYGHCPMLKDGKCSIYEYRPLTCRNYDCRIFAAAGIIAGDDDKTLIFQRARNWKFSYPTQFDCDQHSAVQAVVRFFHEHAECFPAGVPSTSSQLAIVAIKVYDIFLKYNSEFDKSERADIEVAKAIMEANDNFEAMRLKNIIKVKKDVPSVAGRK
jgi:Fe-S-cluster containining protein